MAHIVITEQEQACTVYALHLCFEAVAAYDANPDAQTIEQEKMLRVLLLAADTRILAECFLKPLFGWLRMYVETFENGVAVYMLMDERDRAAYDVCSALVERLKPLVYGL